MESTVALDWVIQAAAGAVLVRHHGLRGIVAVLIVAAACCNPITLAASGDRTAAIQAASAVASFVTADSGLWPAAVPAFLLFFASSPLQALCAFPALVLVAWQSGGRAWRESGAVAYSARCAGWAAGIASLTILWARSHPGSSPIASLSSYASVDAGSPWPELSLHWYLHASAFRRFLPFFQLISRWHPALYVAPVVIRFWRQPAVAFVVLFAVSSLLDATGGYSLARLPVAAAFILCHQRAVSCMRDVHVWAALAALALAASPGLKHVWLVSGTGNANILWVQQLVFGVAATTVVAEFASAALREAKARKAGGGGEGAAVAVTAGLDGAAGVSS